MKALARFRADPAKVRVGVRPLASGWLASVSRRGWDLQEVQRTGATPVDAIDAALDAADAADMPGIDLGMQLAYAHPWGVDT